MSILSEAGVASMPEGIHVDDDGRPAAVEGGPPAVAGAAAVAVVSGAPVALAGTVAGAGIWCCCCAMTGVTAAS